jgi:hypothetical protein
LISYLAKRLARHQLLYEDISEGRRACDNTVRLLDEAIAACDLKDRKDDIIEWFGDRGMFCDCTVLRYLALYWSDDSTVNDIFSAFELWPNDEQFQPEKIVGNPVAHRMARLRERRR